MTWALAALLLLSLSGGCAATEVAAAGRPSDALRVGLVEWDVAGAAQSLAGGPVTLVVTNAGTTEHDLRVRGDRADSGTPTLAPGERATLEVDLGGEQEVLLWCSLPGHRAQGMARTVPVAPAR